VGRLNDTRFLAVSILFVFGVAQAIHAQSFSVAPTAGIPGSTSPSGIPPDDIFTIGPTVVLPGVGPVFGGPPATDFVNVDGFSFGHTPQGFATHVGLEFSVAPFSFGAPGSAVAAEAAGAGLGPGDEPADIYFGPVPGPGNVQVFDGDGAANPGTAPGIGLIEPFPSAGGDDVDGYDARVFIEDASAIYFSVDPASLGPPPGFADPGDVYLTLAPGPGYDTIPPAALYAPGPGPVGVAGSLQLAVGDNVDALVVVDDGDFAFTPSGVATDLILFSLDPASPSFTTAGSPYFGAGAGDVLFVDNAGGAGVFAPGTSLGLTGGDDLNALDLRLIPEPATLGLLLFGVGLLLAVHRRR